MNTVRLCLFLLVLSSSLANAQPLIWNKAAIDNLHSNPDSRLYNEIIRQADAICKAEPVAVTEKKESRSGNKHNYESMSIYLWRDTNNPQGPYITKDGEINPKYKEYDMPRLDKLTTYLRYLSVAYYLTSDGRYFEALCRQLDTWFINKETRMNADFEYSQFIPGINNGKGSSAGIIDAYNFNDVIEAIRLTNTVKNIGKKRGKAIRKWFRDFAGWMKKSDIGKGEAKMPNNHGTAYDITLYNMSAFAGQTCTCKKILKNFTALRIDPQIQSDGTQPLELMRTRAFHYSVYNLTHIIDFAILLGNEGKTFSGTTKTAAALEYLAQFIGRQEEFPYKEIGNWQESENMLKHELKRYAKTRNSERLMEQEVSTTVTNINTLLR